MRRLLALASLVSVIPVLAAEVRAATGLASPPTVVPASGEVSCACVNLTTESINVVIGLDDGVPFITALGPGLSGTISMVGGPAPSMTFCHVFRSGGGKVSTKQLACSAISIDADGNPRAVAPLDRKIQQ